VALLRERGRIVGAHLRDREDGAEREVRAAHVVNATGPWADQLRALGGFHAPALAPSRGTHVVLDRPLAGPALMLLGERRGRRTFVLPWRGRTLVGTTDLPETASPEQVAPSAAEVRSLLSEAAAHFPGWQVAEASVLSAFAGVRPLLRAGTASTLDAPRDHAILSEDGLFTLVGGKLTTWRSMAADLVDRMIGPPPPGLRRASRERAVAPPAPPAAGLPPHLAALYGARARAVAVRAAADPGAAERLDAEGPEIAAQVDVAVEEEFARRVEDVVLRRLPVSHDPGRCRALAAPVAARLRLRRGWSDAREREEIRGLEAALARGEAWREPSSATRTGSGPP
jgi:glycerol-3-phosphate dehydrogenase